MIIPEHSISQALAPCAPCKEPTTSPCPKNNQPSLGRGLGRGLGRRLGSSRNILESRFPLEPPVRPVRQALVSSTLCRGRWLTPRGWRLPRGHSAGLEAGFRQSQGLSPTLSHPLRSLSEEVMCSFVYLLDKYLFSICISICLVPGTIWAAESAAIRPLSCGAPCLEGSWA